LHELEYNSADEAMVLPTWVKRPTVAVHALVASSFMLAWLIAEQASQGLFTVDEVRSWYLPAGLGVALLWALGLRYAWVVAASAFLGQLVVWQQPIQVAVMIGVLRCVGCGGTAWLLRRSVPPGQLPRRPIDMGGLIASILGGSVFAALAGVALLYALGAQSSVGAGEAIVGWATSDTLGVLVVAPLMVMVVSPWLCYKLCKSHDEVKARYVRTLGASELERSPIAWGMIAGVGVGLAVMVCLPVPCDPRVYYLGFIALPALAMRYQLAGGLAALLLTCVAGLFAVGVHGIELATLADLQLILIALAISTILVGSFAVMRSWAEQRRQAEHRWATLAIRGSGMGRWYWDLDTQRLTTDYVLTDAFGYRRDKVSAHLSWWEQRVHPDDVRRNRMDLERLMRGQGDYYEAENRMLAADGSWGWYHSQGTVVERDSSGRPRRIAGTHHDITERKELEQIRADAEATHRSEQRFRTLAGGAPVAIFQTDAKGVFLYVNPAWREMTGHDQTDALYRSAAEFAHSDDRDAVSDHWATAIQTGTSVSVEHRVVKPDGSILWLQTQATPMKYNGVMLGYVGTGVNVTPYREAMAMISDSEARYRTLADHAYDMLWRVTADGNFTYLSPSAKKMLGYEPQEMVGTDAFSYFHPEDVDRVRTKHEAMSPDAPEFHDIHRYRRKDGTYIVFEAVGRLVVSEDKQQPYITGISRDVTQRVESERIRRELEDKLARSQKLDAIGTFATGIAHDFRNSLLAIKASAQSAGRKLDEDHPAQPALATVNDACTQAMQVTQSLLTFARGPGSTKRRTDLVQLIRDNVRLMSAVIPSEVDLVLICPDQPVKLLANVGEMQQLLLNLVMNAKDAIKGEGRIRIALSKTNDAAELVVSDTGCGMPPDVLNRALEPFFTTKARLKGTGLGLSQVHGIVTDHAGEITLKSALGQGTTITITLPLNQKTPPASKTNPKTEAAAS